MKRMNLILSTLVMLLAAAPNVFAAATARVYSSSMLVLIFVGFLALVVVIQLIPAIMTLVGTVTGLAKKRDERELAKAEAGK